MVVTGLAEDPVEARRALELVGAESALDAVVATAARDAVVAGEHEDAVGLVAARDAVTVIGSDDAHLAAEALVPARACRFDALHVAERYDGAAGRLVLTGRAD